MLDIGWSEFLVVAVVALIIIGPKDLPAALRALGKWSGKMKRMARDFQGQFNEALREAELDDVKKQVTDIGRIDPMADLRKDLTKADFDMRASLNKPAAATPAKPTDPELKQLTTDKGTDEPAPVAETKHPEGAEPAAATGVAPPAVTPSSAAAAPADAKT